MSAATWTALIIGAWGAILSTFLAVRQILRERRKLDVVGRTLVWSEPDLPILEVLEVRALNNRLRPVQVLQAGVIQADGTVFHPHPLPLSRFGRAKAPRMLSDGESISFYFDLLSFEGGAAPKAVWVQDFADNRYESRLSRKERRGIENSIPKIRERVGSASTQMDA